MRVEPVPNEAALLLRGRSRILVVADVHLGLVRFYDDELVQRIEKIAESVEADEVVVLGDLKHAIGRANVEKIFRGFGFKLTVVKGNHDGGLKGFEVADPRGIRIGKVGLFHGHANPSDDVIQSKVIVFAHAHPSILIGGVKERAWVLGSYEGRRVIVMPAINDLCASTALNVSKPVGVMFRRWDYRSADIFMLDGTYLGPLSILSTSRNQRQYPESP